MATIRRLLSIAFLVLIVLVLGVSRCGAPLAQTVSPGLLAPPPNVDATVAAGINATLTALAPVPTVTTAPGLTPVPSPTAAACSGAALATPAALERAYYVCGGKRWMFEGWHFSQGYVRQEGSGCFRVQSGEFLSGCQLDYIDRWDNEWQRWDRK